MYLLILWLPLLGSILTGFLGRFLGHKGSSIISIICVFLSTLLSILAFYEVGLLGINHYITVSPWIEVGLLKISWSFLFDSITVTMLVVITLISSLVHLYSLEYMQNDPHLPRFMAFLEIFTFFMLVLVTSDNLVQMFVGWEGVGLASYLLINFWFTRLAANQSAIKALVVNRIGDFGLSLGILTTFYIFQSVDYLTIFSLIPLYTEYYLNFGGFYVSGLTLIGIFLFIGAVGKSAQLGLHTWLPDAMEGPTPVSALIHAATMVTAGVFLLIRFSPLIEFSSTVLNILIVFGSLTAFFAGMTGVFQNDLKRVIAYSTCSQLGYMVFSCGISCYNISMFHLANHAFFKALLFLSAGSVIHALANEQDMRRMGSLVKFLPLTYSLMLIGSLALVGFPFLTGFYSKDFILEVTQITLNNNLQNIQGAFACWLGNLSVFFTAFYSFRLIYLTFINSVNTTKKIVLTSHEPSLLMLVPLIILGLGSIFIGYLGKDLFIGLGTDFWKSAIFILPSNSYFIEAEWLSVNLKWLPFLLSSLGILLASFINTTKIHVYLYNTFYRNMCFLVNKKWYWDILYNRFFVYPLLNFGYLVSFKNLDRGFIELSGPYGLSRVVTTWSQLFSNIQTGQLSHYLFFIVLGVCLFLITIFNQIELIIFYSVLIFFI
uniref:NADH-ubiquinone oxidoreductase chain 5 n=1 Tax=Gracilaria vermiculophylla TaxID=2608709 RepID=A0A0F6N2D0_9FLOR|nr:NADH dehydrogenase subunit 5 [Gracilaria vermiculophylla]AHZ58200.1 NADH dehydrogenase subunit 5 [Gracilaria vermiculophylla]AHZ58225.1 NADH dehydrogenase subunit 5 [Gracilaria vermiculophylla]AXI97810.1 NADH dehydrogenase subunit 5 [Gracilaria vermiculophylla]WDZ68077.1 NADH dehydrogenase subunit 5 [Gracilaria vermiculophylla]